MIYPAIALGSIALYVTLLHWRPKLGAVLGFAVFAWLGYLEAVHGTACGVTYAAICCATYGGGPLLLIYSLRSSDPKQV